jgi:hypothetical protein
MVTHMVRRPKWAAASTANPATEAAALAARGVLRAAGWNPETVTAEERLAAILLNAVVEFDGIKSTGLKPILWQSPEPLSRDAEQDTFTEELAGAWKRVFKHHLHHSDGIARLSIDVRTLPDFGQSTMASTLTSVVRALAGPFIEKRSFDPHSMSINSMEPGDVVAVSVAAINSLQYHHAWSWPLRVGIEPTSNNPYLDYLYAARGVERGFLNINAVGGQDLVLLTDPSFRSLAALQEAPPGMVLVTAPLRTSKGLVSKVLKGGIAGEFSQPTAFIDMVPGSLPEAMTTLSYEIAHNKPLDVAIFDAYGRALYETRRHGRKVEVVPPLIISPVADNAALFDNARLINRVHELIERLGRLPANTVVGLPLDEWSAWQLGISIGAQTAADYRADLILACKENRLVFDQERHAATSLKDATETVSRAEDNLKADLSEPMRFTDVTLYKGFLYKGDVPAADQKVPDDEPLSAGRDYTLEVRVGEQRTGIARDEQAPRGVKNLREDREDLTVFVLVRCKSPAVLHFENCFASIVWPFGEDSESAFFRLGLDEAPAAAGSVTIEIRLYHHTLDLLDQVEAVLSISETAAPTLPNKLVWQSEIGTPRIEAASPPRFASIHVSAAREGGYRFDFHFRSPNERNVIVPTFRTVADDDLRRLLERVRDFWTRQVMASYAEKLNVTPSTFKKSLEELVAIGKDAFITLFGDGYADQKGAGETVAELLARIEGMENAPLQVTFSPDAVRFVFPWSIIYPRHIENVDPGHFWGARYQIEQVRAGSKVDRLGEDPINITFALDPGFGDSREQAALFSAYAAAPGRSVKVSQPINTADELFADLCGNPASHLYYFFCHGWAPSGEGILPADVKKLLEEQVEHLEGAARVFAERLLALVPQMGKEAWIFIGNSQLGESALRSKQSFFQGRRPIVFLNMCHSAALMPSMNSGLVRMFLDRSASAVIGTESPMTPVFAHAFSKQVLGSLLGGETIGNALQAARRHFLDERNPLGLAYTLYGRATTRLGAKPP